jgi:hypothetical protein
MPSRRTVASLAAVALVAAAAAAFLLPRAGGTDVAGESRVSVVAGVPDTPGAAAPTPSQPLQGPLPADHPVPVAVRQVVATDYEQQFGRALLRDARIGTVVATGTGDDRSYRVTLSVRDLDVTVLLGRRGPREPGLCREGDDGCRVDEVPSEPPAVWYVRRPTQEDGRRSRTVEVALANRNGDDARWAGTVTATGRVGGGDLPGWRPLIELAWLLVTTATPAADRVDLPPESLPAPSGTPSTAEFGGPLDPRNRLPADLTADDVERAMREVAAQVRAGATSPVMRDLEYYTVSRVEPSDRPAFEVFFDLGDEIQVLVRVAPWREGDTTVCDAEDARPPCRRQARATTPESQWILTRPRDAFPRDVTLEVRLVYDVGGEDPWSASVVAHEVSEAPTGVPFPTEADLEALALAAATALAPPSVTS